MDLFTFCAGWTVTLSTFFSDLAGCSTWFNHFPGAVIPITSPISGYIMFFSAVISDDFHGFPPPSALLEAPPSGLADRRLRDRIWAGPSLRQVQA